MTQDPKAREEIQNLYGVLVTLSETVKNQEERIQELEKELPDEEKEVSEEVPCPLCGEEFTLEAISHHFNSSDDHPNLNEVFKTDEDTWECPDCLTELSSKETLYKHGREQHDKNLTLLMWANRENLFFGDEEYECPICGDRFETAKQLITHVNKKPDHDTISDHFKLGNGRYLNPEMDEYYVDYTKFHNSWLNTDYTMSEYFLQHFGELPAQE